VSVCIAYRWRVRGDAYAWLLTFTDSHRCVLGRSPCLDEANSEIGDAARRFGYPLVEVIPACPSEALGQARQEVARA
jgi:hypothetical protein